ncbi:MAG TPA: ATP-grasp domain-containing protein [Methanoregulaceae archaeon]|nr:ATP-grasp domain-containing protein [Methanoregulaceae archaeon]
MSSRVLIAGFATRHVARSARAAGYRVCCVDHFCDQDLVAVADECRCFSDLEALPVAISDMAERYRFDLFVPTSGAELLDVPIPRFAPAPETAAPFMDKLCMAGYLSGLGVPVPATLPEGTFPAMLKPSEGSGGWRNTVVRNRDDWVAWKEMMEDPPVIWQEVVSGIPASVCCVCNGTAARAVAVNEQILRGGTEARYGFSGSITPFVHPLAGEMVRYAEKIASGSGCVGTLGVDFVVGDRPYVIEVNPRFQGTVDTVEMATGVNLFSLHVSACEGQLPETNFTPRQFAARKILFAEEDLIVDKNLMHYSRFISDIPWPGASFEKGEAVVSVYGTGPDRHSALEVLDKHISTVRQYIKGSS